jgi:hypothetical protein
MRSTCVQEGSEVGGDPVGESTRQAVIFIWQRLKERHPRPSAAQVREALRSYVDVKKPPGVTVPSLRKIQYILRDAKDEEKRSPEQELQNRPWTMATLSRAPLPADSVPHILQVWRYCCHTGEPFTIRQAKWVSKLCHIPPLSAYTTMLWCLSYMYAKKEELSIASGKQTDTFLDDANLAMTDLELQTYLELSNGQHMRDPYGLALPIHSHDNWVVEEALHPIDHYTDLLNGIISSQRDKKLIDRLINKPSLQSLKLDPDIQMIYLSWLTHIKKSEQWSKLNADQALDVILALRQWAQKQQSIHHVVHQPRPVKVTRQDDGTHVLAFTDSLPKPDEALRLLSQYAQEETKK